MDRRVGVAADPRIIANSNVDRAGGLLVKEDGANEPVDTDVGADPELGEGVRVVADGRGGGLDVRADRVVVDGCNEAVRDLDRYRLAGFESAVWHHRSIDD